MAKTYIQSGTTRILYEDGALSAPGENCLRPGYWAGRDAIAGGFRGRDTALKVNTPAGPAVLRRFRRGGMAAGVLGDRYLYTGWERSRAFREWRLLEALKDRRLPVPTPLAASCERAGLWYRAGLLTELIPDTETFADRIESGTIDADQWRVIGAAIRRFHDAGVEHADLNTRNILLDGAGRVYLVDFDRGRLVDPATVRRRAMLNRLHRSIEKTAPGAPGDGWQKLLTGYHAESP